MWISLAAQYQRPRIVEVNGPGVIIVINIITLGETIPNLRVYTSGPRIQLSPCSSNSIALRFCRSTGSAEQQKYTRQ
jgi:hypothetical protein